MAIYTLDTSPNASAIEQCCLTKLDKRFVIGAQIALALLSLNLIQAFHGAFAFLAFGIGFTLVFMLLEQVWAYALAKVLAMVLLAVYSLDILSLVPLMPISTLSHEAISISLGFSEGLGIWVCAMLIANLRPVSLREIF